MTSSNGNLFRVTGHLCGEFTGHRWILCTKASDAELWCLSLICAWINGKVNNRDVGDLRRHRAHYDWWPPHMYAFRIWKQTNPHVYIIFPFSALGQAKNPTEMTLWHQTTDKCRIFCRNSTICWQRNWSRCYISLQEDCLEHLNEYNLANPACIEGVDM